jgi:hypothetical protein
MLPKPRSLPLISTLTTHSRAIRSPLRTRSLDSSLPMRPKNSSDDTPRRKSWACCHLHLPLGTMSRLASAFGAVGHVSIGTTTSSSKAPSVPNLGLGGPAGKTGHWQPRKREHSKNSHVADLPESKKLPPSISFSPSLPPRISFAPSELQRYIRPKPSLPLPLSPRTLSPRTVCHLIRDRRGSLLLQSRCRVLTLLPAPSKSTRTSRSKLAIAIAYKQAPGLIFDV